MSMKKAVVDIAAMILIGIAILAVLLLLQSDLVNKLFEIESRADIAVEINDQTTGLVSFLQSKTSDSSYADYLVYQLSGLDVYDMEKEMNENAEKMDIAVIIFDKDGKTNKIYGKRRLGDVLYVEIPLAGGKTSSIGLVTDFKMIDFGKISDTGGGNV